MHKTQITSISFFKYDGFVNKFGAFKNMGTIPFQLAKVQGLKFFKLMGSGKGNGFSILPNLNVYAFLGVWSDVESFETFLNTSFYKKWNSSSKEQFHVHLKAFQAHGTWDSKQPFQMHEKTNKNSPIGVITRATIKKRHLINFWKDVPKVSASVDDKEGRFFSIGIGELPLILQSTFSIWESKEHMEAFAYKSKYHKEVIQKTRQLGWYKEEMFARFEIEKIYGNWAGLDLNKISGL